MRVAVHRPGPNAGKPVVIGNVSQIQVTNNGLMLSHPGSVPAAMFAHGQWTYYVCDPDTEKEAK